MHTTTMKGGPICRDTFSYWEDGDHEAETDCREKMENHEKMRGETAVSAAL